MSLHRPAQNPYIEANTEHIATTRPTKSRGAGFFPGAGDGSGDCLIKICCGVFGLCLATAVLRLQGYRCIFYLATKIGTVFFGMSVRGTFLVH